MNCSKLIIFASVAIGLLGMQSCRPRASRTTAAKKAAPAVSAFPSTPGAPSARSVLNRADSALARIAQMNDVPMSDAPPVAQQMSNTMGGYPPMGYPASPMAYPAPPMGYPPLRTPMGSTYAPQPSISDYGLYEAALGQYNRHQYDAAINMFSQVVAVGRPPELTPNAYYWMGESNYAMGRYSESMPYFEYVTRVGPQYKREMSLYKLSRANLFIGNRQGANMWYERLRNEYPKSSYARTLAKLGTR